MRILVKPPLNPVHVEMTDGTIDDLNRIVRGEATITLIDDDIAIAYDIHAEEKCQCKNIMTDEIKAYGRVAVIGYENGEIKEFPYQLDKLLKQKYPFFYQEGGARPWANR